MSFYHIKNLLYYFTTSFYNISFIRYFIIQFYTLKLYLLRIKIYIISFPLSSTTATTSTAQSPATNIHCRNNTSTANQPPQLLTNIRSTQIAAKKKKKNPQLERGRVKGGQRREGRGWDRWRPQGEITCQTQTYHRLNPLSSSHRQAPPLTTKSTNHWLLLKPIYHHRWI